MERIQEAEEKKRAEEVEIENAERARLQQPPSQEEPKKNQKI